MGREFGSTVSDEARAESLRRKDVYKTWIHHNLLRATSDMWPDSSMMFPFGDPAPRYRDTYREYVSNRIFHLTTALTDLTKVRHLIQDSFGGPISSLHSQNSRTWSFQVRWFASAVRLPRLTPIVSQYPYDSRVTKITEYLPVSIAVISAGGRYILSPIVNFHARAHWPRYGLEAPCISPRHVAQDWIQLPSTHRPICHRNRPRCR